MEVLRIADLPDAPLAAAAMFHGEWLPRAQALLGRDDLTVVFAPADHTHRGWRLAATQALARAHAPRRINAIASADAPTIDVTVAYLAQAPGVTGQYLMMDDTVAARVVSSGG